MFTISIEDGLLLEDERDSRSTKVEEGWATSGSMPGCNRHSMRPTIKGCFSGSNPLLCLYWWIRVNMSHSNTTIFQNLAIEFREPNRRNLKRQSHLMWTRIRGYPLAFSAWACLTLTPHTSLSKSGMEKQSGQKPEHEAAIPVEF